MKIITPPTRTCPECEGFGLEVSERSNNVYECQICGSIWERLEPINVNGKMKNIPKKLKKLFY